MNYPSTEEGGLASFTAWYLSPDLTEKQPNLWARHRLTEGFSLGAAAKATGTSARTLARRLKTVLGKTPLSYFQDLRVERAVHLLRTSSDSINLIASQVGYANGVTLRTLLRRRIGRSVSELRAGN